MGDYSRLAGDCVQGFGIPYWWFNPWRAVIAVAVLLAPVLKKEAIAIDILRG